MTTPMTFTITPLQIVGILLLWWFSAFLSALVRALYAEWRTAHPKKG